MEAFLIKAFQLIVALSLLVVVHEFGHYFFSRIFGIRVEKFYLFFNPWFTPFKWKPKPPKKRKYNADGTPKSSWRDTEYGIGWLPLGGYCKIAGMVDESMDKEQLAKPAAPDEFRSRPAYQRLLVMVGGVMFNFIFACLIYIGMAWYYGDKYVPFEKAYAGMEFADPAKFEGGYADGDILLAADGKYVDAAENDAMLRFAEARTVTVLRAGDTITIENPKNFALQFSDEPFFTYRMPVYVKQVEPRSIAEKAGLKSGDHIVKVGGEDTPSFQLMTDALKRHSGKPTEIVVERDGSELSLTATPDEGKLGFVVAPIEEVYEVETISYNLFQAIPEGISDGCEQMSTYVTSLKYLFTKQGAQSVGGFGSIGNIFPDKWNWFQFWNLCAFLSIILAFMNILPIPALDGGHVMFVLWEIITRRKPSEKFLEYAQMCGMFFLLALLLYANANDIYKFVFR